MSNRLYGESAEIVKALAGQLDRTAIAEIVAHLEQSAKIIKKRTDSHVSGNKEAATDFEEAAKYLRKVLTYA